MMECHLKNKKCQGESHYYARHNFGLCWFHARRLGCPEVCPKSLLEACFPGIDYFINFDAVIRVPFKRLVK